MRRKLKTEVLNLRITPELKEKLKSEASEKGTTISDIIEEAVIRYFNETPTVLEAIQKINKRIKVLEKKGQSKKKGQ